LWWVVDTLASEYGWAKSAILNDVYIDELPPLLRQISGRHIRDYKMQLAIIQNPHTKDPKHLWRILQQSEPRKPTEDVFDASGFERLKAQMSQSPRIIVK
jgi:hypothetical protein